MESSNNLPEVLSNEKNHIENSNNFQPRFLPKIQSYGSLPKIQSYESQNTQRNPSYMRSPLKYRTRYQNFMVQSQSHSYPAVQRTVQPMDQSIILPDVTKPPPNMIQFGEYKAQTL